MPTGQDRHELYCEVPIEAVVDPAHAAKSPWWRRPIDRFRQLVADAEEDHRRRERGQPSHSSGPWHWIMRKVAEAIAEQRLLWSLRHVGQATLRYPDDVAPARALEIARESFRGDFEKHRRWLAVDALLTLACLPLTIIPGPNVPSLYFTFRSVGHYFSMRGARQGLSRTEWQTSASSELTALRRALDLEGADRRARVDEVGSALGLDRLGAFVDRLI